MFPMETPNMIAIYEPLYKPDQAIVEHFFLPIDFRENTRPSWREFHLYVEMYRRGLHQKHLMTGLFSPKFRLKTRMSGERFLDFVRSHQSFDVCFVNPFPQLAVISRNVWMEGELAHPGMLERAQNLLDACGFSIDLSATPRQASDVLCYSNFWVGTAGFWEKYVGGLLIPIANFICKNSDQEVVRALFDDTEHTSESPFLPFIIERLFSTFLSFNPDIHCAALELDPEEMALNEMELELVRYNKRVIPELSGEGTDSALRSAFQHSSNCRQLYNGLLYKVSRHPHIAGS